MEEKDLRIGNIISDNWNNSGIKIPATISNFYDFSNFKNWRPVNLSEEWILKLGFEKNIIDDILFYVKYNEQNTIRVHSKLFNVYICQNNIIESSVHIVRIKYVHELQNLYYSIMGEELGLN